MYEPLSPISAHRSASVRGVEHPPRRIGGPRVTGLLLLFLASASCTGEIGAPREGQPAAPGGPGSGAGQGPRASGGGPPPPTSLPAAFEPGPLRLRRLTASQYRNSIRDLLGEAAAGRLGAEVAGGHLTAQSASATAISARELEQLRDGAFAAARGALGDEASRAALVGCAPAGPEDAACARSFLSRIGLRAWRRPLDEEELGRLVGIATTGAAKLGDFWKGLEVALGALLQSPNFLYRVELGERVPGTRLLRLSDLELASRLSFLLWDTTPDDALLTAAMGGELRDPSGVRAQAERLLRAARFRPAVVKLFDEWLGLEDAPLDRPESPDAPKTLGASMHEETRLAIGELVSSPSPDLRRLLDGRTAFVDRTLAAIYGVAHPGGDGFARVELPANGTSPTLRGRVVLERFLCEKVPDPPPGVATELPEPPAGKRVTTRERFDIHRSSPQCEGCHTPMDGVGVAFEHFDQLGRWRDDEGGLPIDATGTLEGRPFDGALALQRLLQEDPRFGRCMARQVYRHAVGRLDTPTEASLMDELARALEAKDFRFDHLLVTLVASDGFRYGSSEEVAP
jgi:hypothetical protein